MNVSRLSFRGSLARVPTHRHVGYPYSWRKARYRPAGLALTGRDSHPLDGLPSFGFYLILPLLSDQDFLVARTIILPLGIPGRSAAEPHFERDTLPDDLATSKAALCRHPPYRFLAVGRPEQQHTEGPSSERGVQGGE
jgi:hypothetical protein